MEPSRIEAQVKIVNPSYLKSFRLTSRQCEWCKYTQELEVHHVQRRSHGRIDAWCNVLALCGAFARGCHAKADAGIITKYELWQRIACREKVRLETVVEEIDRINRLDKDSHRCPNHGKGKYAGYPLRHFTISHGWEADPEQGFECPECERKGKS